MTKPALRVVDQAGSQDARESSSSCCSCSLARSVLEKLFSDWPMPGDLCPTDFGTAGDAHRHRFVHVMQALLDQGFISYEGTDNQSGQPCFHDVLITPSGRTALRVMRFLATLP